MQFINSLEPSLFKSPLEYKNFKGGDLRKEDNGLITGKVLNIQDLILFQGYDFDELKSDFHEMIDFYLS